MRKKKYIFSLLASLAMVAMLAMPASSVAAVPLHSTQIQLVPEDYDFSTLQFQQPLPILDVTGAPNGTIETIVAGTTQIEVDMKEFKTNMLPPTFVPIDKDTKEPIEGASYNGTYVWGYVTSGVDTSVTRDTYTGPVVVATRGVPTEFKFVNDLGNTADSHVLAYTESIDQSLHWANPYGAPRYSETTDNESQQVWAGNEEHYSGPIAAAVHLHGAEDPAAIDGGPEAWFLSDGSEVGNAFYSMGWDGVTPQNYAIYRYPNVQEAAPLWFHDHTLGATRLNVNVYSGLAGAYALIDPNLVLPKGLGPIGLDRAGKGNPVDDTVIPLVVQDRNFDTNGELFFNAGPDDDENPSVNPEHGYWVPEFFGNTIAVNGKVWPYLDVKAQRYRFFLINGSNARTYVLTFHGNAAGNPKIWQITTDQGYLDAPVGLDYLIVMPGERAEFIVDFAGLPVGSELVLYNYGPDDPFGGWAPGDGAQSDEDTTRNVMRFNVVAGAVNNDKSFDPSVLGATIRTPGQAIVRLVDPLTGTLAKHVDPVLTRTLTLNEVAFDEERTVDDVYYEGGPLEALVNNSTWSGKQPDPINPNEHLAPRDDFSPDGIGNYISEWPTEGTTEVWEIVNLTADAHPIHTHLVQFQLMNREALAMHDEGEEQVPDYLTYAYEPAFPGGKYIPGYGPPLTYDNLTATGGTYGGNPEITSGYLTGVVEPPNANEAGWKDTVFVPPGKATRFVVRFAPTDIGVKANPMVLHYAFLPNDSIPGIAGAIFDYVWHCHIVDHEDNEMMRPDAIVPMLGAPRTFVMGIDY